VTSVAHPLFGQVLGAVGFKRVEGVLFLVVELPDGSPGTIRGDATDVFGEPETGGVGTVLTGEGMRRLRWLTETLAGEMSGRVRKRK
jgi:hypothetical protein